MLINLFWRRSSRRRGITANAVWREGSCAFGAEATIRLREGADCLLRKQSIGEAETFAKVTPNAEVEADLSIAVRSFHNPIHIGEHDDSEDPPRKNLRKRKAKEASVSSRSSSSASRLDWDADFVPSRTPSPTDVQNRDSPGFVALDSVLSASQARRTSSSQQQAVTADNSDCRLDEGDFYASSAESTATMSRLQPSKVSEDLDLTRLGVNFAGISSSIKHAVSSLFANLHLDIGLSSPLLKASGKHLTTLLSRCWGSDWHAACQNMAQSRTISAFHVVEALLAAFLFERVFNDTAWQCDIFEGLNLLMPCRRGKLLLNVLAPAMTNFQADHKQDFFDLTCMTPEQMLDAQRQARGFLADGILRSELPVLHDHANRLAESLILLLHGHITTLSNLAALYNPQQIQLDGVWLEGKFRDQLAQILKEAVDLKLHLNHSKYSHQFIWPTPGTSFDPAHMETVYPSHRDQEEQLDEFKRLPGLSVQVGIHSHYVKPAETVTRAQGIRNGSSTSLDRSL